MSVKKFMIQFLLYLIFNFCLSFTSFSQHGLEKFINSFDSVEIKNCLIGGKKVLVKDSNETAIKFKLKKGKLHGQFRAFYNDGSVALNGQFKKGEPVKEFLFYDSTSKVIDRIDFREVEFTGYSMFKEDRSCVLYWFSRFHTMVEKGDSIEAIYKYRSRMPQLRYHFYSNGRLRLFDSYNYDQEMTYKIGWRQNGDINQIIHRKLEMLFQRHYSPNKFIGYNISIDDIMYSNDNGMIKKVDELSNSIAKYRGFRNGVLVAQAELKFVNDTFTCRSSRVQCYNYFGEKIEYVVIRNLKYNGSLEFLKNQTWQILEWKNHDW